jgi:hypothetical protein
MTVSVGDPVMPDSFAAIASLLEGSSDVKSRLDQLRKAKEDAEAALAALKIGQDAKAAYDDANAKHAQAEAVLAEANEKNDAAIKALADAQSAATDMLTDARKQRDSILAAVAVERQKHIDWMAQAKTDLDAQKALLADFQAKSEVRQAALDQWENELAKTKAGAEQAIADAEAKAAKATKAQQVAQALADQLRNALATATEDGA